MLKPIHAAVVAVLGLSGIGWSANAYLTGLQSRLATQEDLMIAMGKSDYMLDLQMRAVLREIVLLEAKKNKIPEEIAHLQYLRTLLKEMRDVRLGLRK